MSYKLLNAVKESAIAKDPKIKEKIANLGFDNVETERQAKMIVEIIAMSDISVQNALFSELVNKTVNQTFDKNYDYSDPLLMTFMTTGSILGTNDEIVSVNVVDGQTISETDSPYSNTKSVKFVHNLKHENYKRYSDVITSNQLYDAMTTDGNYQNMSSMLTSNLGDSKANDQGDVLLASITGSINNQKAETVADGGDMDKRGRGEYAALMKHVMKMTQKSTAYNAIPSEMSPSNPKYKKLKLNASNATDLFVMCDTEMASRILTAQRTYFSEQDPRLPKIQLIVRDHGIANTAYILDRKAIKAIDKFNKTNTKYNEATDLYNVHVLGRFVYGVVPFFNSCKVLFTYT